MKERFNDIDDKSRDAAQNIRIAFDDNAWDKMEALLNEEDKKPVAPISNTLTAGKDGNKKRMWVLLFLVFFVTGAAILFIKNNNTLKNKTLPLVNAKDKVLDKKAREINQESMTDTRIKKEQLINRYLRQQQSTKNKTGNENFKQKETIDNKTTLSL